MKVELRLLNLRGSYGYDVVITDPRATVADYLQAVEGLMGADRVARLRNPGGTCYGCPRCCAERISLTSIDALRLAEAVGQGRAQKRNGGDKLDQADAFQRSGRTAVASREKGRGLKTGRREADERAPKDGLPGKRVLQVIRRYGWVTVWGRAVDITLRRHDDGTCVFLDTAKGLCLNYGQRPLVCRTYFCCPTTKRARLLREAIVNRGQDELVRLILQETGADKFPVNEADAPDLRPADWPRNAFTGRRDYSEVLLKEVLSPKLWPKVFLFGRQIV